MASGLTASPRVKHAAALAFREFVPRQQHRRLLTWTAAPYAFLYVVPYLFMAYLVRRRDTHLVRILLLPTVIATAIRCTWGYTVGNPWCTFYEWDRGKVRVILWLKCIVLLYPKAFWQL